MTLQQMLYALTVESCGSINKAAETLFISQPSLSAAIKEIESETGISIFLRTRKGIVTTPEGADFLASVKQVYNQYETLNEKYIEKKDIKKTFGVSTQHYSFAVKAFVETAKRYDISRYDLAIRETQTKQVIEDVASLRSEIGILYLSAANKKVMTRLLTERELEFTPLIKCSAYVYLWKGHPLAGKKSISLNELIPYPCLSFEQGDENAFYFAEEILSENIYPRTIRACDRATMLNLMIGINGYTLCSGIISDDLNGSDYVAVAFREDEENSNSIMEIGYITKKYSIRSKLGEEYIAEIKKFLKTAEIK